jgi:formyltetrahydrofolate deformylase
MKTHVLLWQCRDQKGIVAGVTEVIARHGGNIVTADQHSTDPDAGLFFMRVEFNLDEMSPESGGFIEDMQAVAARFGARQSICDKDVKLRMGILVSRHDHCLAELLYLWRSGDIGAQIPFVIGTCDGNRQLAAQYGVPFHYIPATREDPRESEILGIVSGKADFLVLARYMRILSGDFLRAFGKDVINIHHSFLPSFKGAHPYRQAFDQGVKVIGATAHFVTEALDEGPIITQMVESVSHRDTVDGLIRRGRNLEKRALAAAVAGYIDYRIIVAGNKTVIF